ncbi:MAG: sulfatase-like hydrolase/transferase [Bacteroidia bacterium]|nr:sulfatase-like hydrolase/transferase [Bacteroidia bacterium]
MAKRIPLIFLKQFLFWMLLFQLLRIVFMFYNYNELFNSNFLEILKVFWYSIILDVSTSCYLLGVSFILLLFQSLIKWKGFYILNLWFTYLLILVAVVITVGELPLYREWHVKLNFKAISYWSQPSEVFHTAKWSELIFGTLGIVLLTGIGIYFYRRYIHVRFKLEKRNFLVSFLFLITVPVLILLGIRGGYQPIPVHQTDVYFSKNNFLNLAAVNSQWNVMASVTKNMRYKNTNPFEFYKLSDARKTVDSLYYVEKDTTQIVLTTKRPNIVLILLESFSGDLIHSIGGYDSITPNFDKLVKDGIIFSRVYGSGSLSDQGIAAVLCGYPALSNVIMVNQLDKYVKLPCVARDLQEQGYHTSFIFGGQLSYGNIKGLIYYNKFDDIFEGKDFPSNIPQGRLGAHDQYLFDMWLGKISKYPQPFFAAAFTLSSHNPYDQPFPEVFDWGGDSKAFINSAYYTDSCIGDFFAKAKKQPWYNNTLFVLIADHSHNSPRNWMIYSPEYRHIPMLLYGNVLTAEMKGKRMEMPCSQTDLAATLLSQLGLKHDKYHWSKNLFNPYSKPFSYYAFDGGLGWVETDNFFVFDESQNVYYSAKYNSKEDSARINHNGKSYIEMLFQEYLEY